MKKYRSKDIIRAWLYEGGDIPAWMDAEWRLKHKVSSTTKIEDEIIIRYQNEDEEKYSITLYANHYLYSIESDKLRYFYNSNKERFEKEYCLKDGVYRDNEVYEATLFLGKINKDVLSMLLTTDKEGYPMLTIERNYDVKHGYFMVKMRDFKGGSNRSFFTRSKKEWLENYEEVKENEY